MTEYGVHFGKLIKDHISTLKQSENDISKTFGLTPNGFRRKLDNPYFGTVYDLIKVSIILKTDFVGHMVKILEENGVSNKKMKKVYQIEEQLSEAREDLSMYRRIFKNLPDNK